MSNRRIENPEVIIPRSSSLFQTSFLELWQYRELIFLLVRRDFISKYKQTILGPLWFLLQPLLMTSVFVVIFHRVAQIPTDQQPPILFYLCGLSIWQYFARSVLSIAQSFSANIHVLNKVYFPRLILPIVSLLSNLMSFLLQLMLFLVLYFYFKIILVDFDLRIDFFWMGMMPLLILQTMVVALGVGLTLAAATLKYRDLSHVLDLLVMLWMYLTPVIYSLSLVPKQYQAWMIFNPMTIVLEGFRQAFFSCGIVSFQNVMISLGVASVIFILGEMCFSKMERLITDWV